MMWQVELVVVLALVGAAALWLLVRWARTWRRMVHPEPNQPLCESCPFAKDGEHPDCAACALNPSLGGGLGAASHPAGSAPRAAPPGGEATGPEEETP